MTALKTTLEELDQSDAGYDTVEFADACHDARAAHELLRLCKLFVPKPAECEVGDDAPESVRERAEAAKKFWKLLDE